MSRRRNSSNPTDTSMFDEVSSDVDGRVDRRVVLDELPGQCLGATTTALAHHSSLLKVSL